MAVGNSDSSVEGENPKEEVLLMQGDGLHCVEKMTKAKDAVCFIRCNDSGNLKRGSGFFAILQLRGIELRCIVTNNHVISRKQDAAVGFAIFFYEGNNSGREVPLRPDIVFLTDINLDYTIVGCDHTFIEDTLGIPPLPFTNNVNANIGDQIFIFQHPKGNAKQVSYEKISGIQPPYVYYQADTDIGSSGSPVFKKFEVLAVHSKGCDKYNKGTLCTDILSHLNSAICKISPVSPMIECADNTRKRTLETAKDADDAVLPKLFRASEDDRLCQCPSDDILQDLAAKSVEYWKHLGRKLGVPESKIREIHKDNINYDDIRDKTYAMLQAWKEQTHSPSFLLLGKALKALEKNATCLSVCGF